MRRIFFLAIILIFSAGLLMTGCSRIGFVAGTGQVISKLYEYKGFSSIDVSSAFKFEIRQSSNYEVTVSTNEDVFPYLDVHQTGETLIIRLKPGSFTDADMRVVITMPALNKLAISGASEGNVNGFASANGFQLIESGASQLKIEMETGKIQVEISGASMLTGTLMAQDAEIHIHGASLCDLAGSSGFGNIEVSGASQLKAPELLIKDVNAKVSGSSHADIHITRTLNAEVSGASSLGYLGNPILSKINVTGDSKLIDIEK